MKQQHARTLQALFNHPLKHDLRVSDVEALLKHLEIAVEPLADHRLRVQLPSGEMMVLHAAAGLHHPYLDEEGILRLRRLLERGGITPAHPEGRESSARGDQATRLVIHLDHRGARLWWLENGELDTAELRPHGLWSSHQRLSHRHDRDVAGQRAPLDFAYLNELSEAVLEADRVLLLGHGHGQSDLRQLLQEHLQQHHPEALDRIDVVTVDDTACSDAELLAIAREHFGNQPHRRMLQIPWPGAAGGRSACRLREAACYAPNSR